MATLRLDPVGRGCGGEAVAVALAGTLLVAVPLGRVAETEVV